MKILKNILLFVIIIVLSYFCSSLFGRLHDYIFREFGTFIDLSSISGISPAYIFFLPLLFTSFGDKHKYWWIVLLLIPAIAFEAWIDLDHLYFPFILAIVGWLLGLLVSTLVTHFSRQQKTP